MLASIKYERKIILALFYILLLAGGLWHALNVLQDEMRLLASPMIVLICLLLCFDWLRVYEKGSASSGHGKRRINHLKQKFLAWGVFVIVASFLLEFVGVQTGAIFGEYVYLETLRPVVSSVPLAIGFAWLGMIISSIAFAQRITNGRTKSRFLGALLAAAFMVIFDFFMEPAAMKLGYWQWAEHTIPLRNYFAWFVFGGIFSYIGLRLGLFKTKSSTVPVHAYVAQLLYFLIVNLSK